MGGKEILHGLEDLGRQVVQSEGVARTLADAVEQLEQTGEAIVDLLDLDGTFGGGVPVVTLVISLSRETRLLRAGRTTSRAAARNLILDLTGTGVGGMLGLAIGGLAGSLVAPGPGSAAGAMAGAPAGAATGRTITNKIKTRRVRRARDELAQLEKAVPGRVQEAEHQLADAVAGQASVSREAYRAAAGPPRGSTSAADPRSRQWPPSCGAPPPPISARSTPPSRGRRTRLPAATSRRLPSRPRRLG